MDSLRLIGPLFLALTTAVWIDYATARRGLTPPFHRLLFGPHPGRPVPGAIFRRGLSAVGLVAVLWIGVYGPIGLIGQELIEVDFSEVPIARLFQLHAIFALFLVGWYIVGYVPRGLLDPDRTDRSWSFHAQIGLTPSASQAQGKFVWRDAGREIGLGLVLGIAGWLAVLTVLVVIGSLVWTLAGEDALPSQPPAMVSWVAALPWVVRLGISLSAGIVEESFFRGLLQPRCGIALSTGLFVLAHAGYEQPMMLVGVTLLSLFFSALVVWRQSILAAITAHAVFDAVQLLIVIPSVTKIMPGSGTGPGLLTDLLGLGAAWILAQG